MSKKVLIACEESQTITKEFRKLGFEAFSCDVQECSGGFPDWHFQRDVFEVIKEHKFDLMIGHPPCTFLSFAGAGWMNVSKYGDKAIQRIKERDLAIDFFIKLLNADIPHICLENPMGYIQQVIKCNQIIEPFYFGDNERKRTCLWLKNLPKLTYSLTDNLFFEKTSVPPPSPIYTDKIGINRKRYFAESISHKNDIIRRKLRSKTFQGIAQAMANQWSQIL